MATFWDAPLTTTFALDDFRRFAAQGAAIAVVRQREQMKVIALGCTPDGRSVVWLEPTIDTARHFLAALSQEFGKPLAQNTANALHLLPRPGEPLPSHIVDIAIEMAETAQIALEGVRFLETLSASASAVSHPSRK